MVKTFVFDIGNVLVDWHTVPYIMRTLGCSEERARELDRIVFEGVEWKNGDRGICTRQETCEGLQKRCPGIWDEIKPLLDGADNVLVEQKKNTEFLKKLKKAGYGLYYLSNTNPQAFEYMKKNCGFFPLLENGIASFRDGLLKPSHEIFRLFANRFSKDPSECCFIDDTAVNTAAASECGFNVITLWHPDDLEHEILRIEGVKERLEEKL